MLMATTFSWKIPFYENRRVAKTPPQIDSGALEMIRNHNRLDLELYEFGKGLFEASLARQRVKIDEGLAALRALRRPTPIKMFYSSSLGTGRFLLTKITSAL